MKRRDRAVRYLPDIAPATDEYDPTAGAGPADPGLPLHPVTPQVAVDVARWFVDVAASRRAEPVALDEVWVDPGLALCVRYRHGGGRVGRRVADVAADVLGTGLVAGTRMQGVLFFDSLYDGPADPALRERFVDAAGHAWWGDEPAGGWAGVDGPDRLATVLPAAVDP